MHIGMHVSLCVCLCPEDPPVPYEERGHDSAISKRVNGHVVLLRCFLIRRVSREEIPLSTRNVSDDQNRELKHIGAPVLVRHRTPAHVHNPFARICARAVVATGRLPGTVQLPVLRSAFTL